MKAMERIRFICAALLIIILASVQATAKDHSDDYKMGTLTKVPLHVGGKVSAGFTDTTSCNSGLLGVHCTGGIVDDYNGWLVADMPDGTEVPIQVCASGASLAALLLPCSQPYVMTLKEEGGTFIFLDRVWGSRDIGKELETTSKVLYRTEHKPGVTYIKIPDPTNPQKEATFTPIKLPKQKTASPAPTTDNNISSMCASGKLSAELKAKYCTAETEKSAPEPK